MCVLSLVDLLYWTICRWISFLGVFFFFRVLSHSLVFHLKPFRFIQHKMNSNCIILLYIVSVQPQHITLQPCYVSGEVSSNIKLWGKKYGFVAHREHEISWFLRIWNKLIVSGESQIFGQLSSGFTRNRTNSD